MVEESPIRVATPEDLDEIMKLGMELWKEIAVSELSMEKVLGLVWGALTQENGLIAVIGKPGERIEGGILLVLGSLWYSDDKVLEERGIFINNDFRSSKGGRARRLCEFAKETAKKLGIPLMVGAITNDRTEAKMRLYERQFGKPAGFFFLYNGVTGTLKDG